MVVWIAGIDLLGSLTTNDTTSSMDKLTHTLSMGKFTLTKRVQSLVQPNFTIKEEQKSLETC